MKNREYNTICSTCIYRTKKTYEKPCCNCGSYGHYKRMEEEFIIGKAKNPYSVKDNYYQVVKWPREKDFKTEAKDKMKKIWGTEKHGMFYPLPEKRLKEPVSLYRDEKGLHPFKKPKYKHICLECWKRNIRGCPFYQKLSCPDGIYKERVIPKHIKSCSAFESQARQDVLDAFDSSIKALNDKRLMVFGTRKIPPDLFEDFVSNSSGGKCEFYWSNIMKDKINKGGVKDMEKGLEDFKEHLKNDMKIAEKKEEIQKVKKLIYKEKEKRKKRIRESYFEKAFKYKYENDKKWRIKKEVFNFLKTVEKINKETLKKIKKFRIRTNEYVHLEIFKVALSKKEWYNFEEILCIIDEYYPKFELYKEKKELCRLTDCYKKLATEKVCSECGSTNPIKAIYCNQCGAKI